MAALGRTDETYIKIKGEWKYLYPCCGFGGEYPRLTARVRSRNGKAAARFFHKVLKSQHTGVPRVITVDKNAAYPVVIETLKQEETIGKETELRQSKYLNNVIE